MLNYPISQRLLDEVDPGLTKNQHNNKSEIVIFLRKFPFWYKLC